MRQSPSPTHVPQTEGHMNTNLVTIIVVALLIILALLLLGII